MLRASSLALISITCVLAMFASPSSWLLDLSRIRNNTVHYAEYSSLKQFPVPVVSWRRPGLVGSEAELEKVKSTVIYPIINESVKPVSAIVVEFSPSDSQSIGLVVIWSDGDTRESLVSKNEKGEFDPQAYKVIFAKPVP